MNFYVPKAARVGEDTAFRKILHFIEGASSAKAPIAQLADRVSGVLVPVMMGIAVLVISCPWTLVQEPILWRKVLILFL